MALGISFLDSEIMGVRLGGSETLESIGVLTLPILLVLSEDDEKPDPSLKIGEGMWIKSKRRDKLAWPLVDSAIVVDGNKNSVSARLGGHKWRKNPYYVEQHQMGIYDHLFVLGSLGVFNKIHEIMPRANQRNLRLYFDPLQKAEKSLMTGHVLRPNGVIVGWLDVSS